MAAVATWQRAAACFLPEVTPLLVLSLSLPCSAYAGIWKFAEMATKNVVRQNKQVKLQAIAQQEDGACQVPPKKITNSVGYNANMDSSNATGTTDSHEVCLTSTQGYAQTPQNKQCFHRTGGHTTV